jgi:hypothetical protein
MADDDIVFDNFGDEKEDRSPDITAIPENKKLEFAKLILFGLAAIFLLGMVIRVMPGFCFACSADGAAATPITSFVSPEGAKDVFEACKTILPPIATLVLGYYFGKN